MAQSRRAQQATARRTISGDRSQSVVLNGKSGPISEESRRMGQALVSAKKASEENRLSTAVGILEAQLRAAPDSQILISDLADAYFRSGRAKDAYGILAPWMQESVGNALLMRGSLAAARVGEVYPGQLEYCEAYFRDYYEASPEALVGAFPTGKSPLTVEVLSLVALAKLEDGFSDANTFYFSREALRKDPGNPIASLTLGDLQLRRKEYSGAASTYAAGISRARGVVKRAIGENLRTARAYRDATTVRMVTKESG